VGTLAHRAVLPVACKAQNANSGPPEQPPKPDSSRVLVLAGSGNLVGLGYVFSLGSDLTGVAAGRGLEARDTRGRDARDTIARHGGVLHG
jgi:hypothetical protein